ncbi:hypothetical protein [Anaerocolumna jejuensis]|uniref:hypothetical protein n=1 Tax=Anaerocolumna jejuensis TaxID=259063 RepID=UPI003F7C266C
MIFGVKNKLSDSKGIFKVKRRSELSSEIAGLEKRIANMKAHLSGIVREYGFKNVEAFYKALHQAKGAYSDYLTSLQKWEQQYGEKPQSLHDKLKAKAQEAKERQSEKEYRQNKDREALEMII